jgi:hypothetical protein
MKKFRGIFCLFIMAMTALVLAGCFFGGDEDEGNINTPPPATVGGTAEDSIELPGTDAMRNAPVTVSADGTNGFSVEITFSLSGEVHQVKLTMSGKPYTLTRAGEENGSFLGTWQLANSDDSITLTFRQSGTGCRYKMDYTLDCIPINSLAQLQRIGGDYPLNGKYELTDDISLTDWTPIGNVSQPFTGAFDGQDKTITLNGFDAGALSGNLGIFGYTMGAEIHDLNVNLNWEAAVSFALTGLPGVNGSTQYVGGAVGYASSRTSLESISVSGSAIKVSKNQNAQAYVYVGGIAGRCRQAEISGCTSTIHIDASVTSGWIVAGGIAGDNHTDALITRCSATGSIEAAIGNDGRATAGGIAGRNRSSVIKDSWAGGEIRATASGSNSEIRAGGIAGHNFVSLDADRIIAAATITDCYATGTVSATEGTRLTRAGGIAGQNSSNQADNPTTLRRCYSTGAINASGSGNSVYAGGIVAGNDNSSDPAGRGYGRSVVENCYALGDISAGGSASWVCAGGLSAWGTSNASVRYSAALNQQITNSSSGDGIYRIGSMDQPVLTGNIAYSGMLLNGTSLSSNDPNGIHGESKSSVELKTQGTWTALFRDSNFGADEDWKWINGYDYPVLSWQTSAPEGAPALP